MRFGLVGLGYWGQKYVRLLSQRQDAALVAMCDLSQELVDYARAAAPTVHATTDAEAVLGSPEVDAIVIATPANSHYELAQRALDSGKHVLCEKPLTMTTNQSEDLIDLAGRVRRTLFVGHTFVYNGAIRAARDFVAADEFGPALYARGVWTAPGPVRHDVNALWDLGPHPISILAYVLGRQPVSVAATGQSILDARREDVVSMHLRFDDAVSADVHLSWIAPRKVRALTITGAQKIALFDDMEPLDKLRLFDTATMNTNGAVPVAPPEPRTLRLPDEPVHVPEISTVEPLEAQLRHFLECCLLGLTPESDGRAGTNVVSVLEAAQASLGSGGRPIKIGSGVAAWT